MKTKKATNKGRAIPPREAGDPRRRSTIDSNASKEIVELDLQRKEAFTSDTFTKRIQRQTLRAFLDAVRVWRLNGADSARLVSAEPASVAAWRAGKAPTSEEVLARMTMVALIRTALDITFPPSLSTAWMTVPNTGYPYSGLSPVAYAIEHGWPGLFWVLRQYQGADVGN